MSSSGGRDERTYRLLAQQESLWFLHRLGRDAGYNVPIVLQLADGVVLPALRRAVDDMIERHEALRTQFVQDGTRVRQRIVDASIAKLVLGVSHVATEDLVHRRMEQVLATPFNLATGLPITGILLRSEQTGHWTLVLNVHHIVFDAWSAELVIADLEYCYESRVRDEVPAPPSTEASYARYLDSEADRAITGDDVAFWSGALHGLPSRVSVPSPNRPTDGGGRSARLPLILDAAVHERVLAVAVASRASIFVVLETALAFLMSRYGAGDDVPIGFPYSLRGESCTEDLVGYLVNPLVIRNRLHPAISFRTAIEDSKEFLLSAMEHSAVPFSDIARASGLAGSHAVNPLFQVSLAVQNTFRAVGQPGIFTRELAAPTIAPNDLSFFLTVESRGRAAAGIHGFVQYDADRYTVDFVRTLVRDFTGIIDSLATDPERCLRDLEIAGVPAAPDSSAGRLPPVPAGAESCLADFVRLWASAQPAACALEDSELRLTYAELLERAQWLSDELRGNGVRPGDLVAVCLPRSVEWNVSMVALDMLDAVSVPVDPSYPQARQESILAATSPTALLRNEGSGASPPGAELSIVVVALAGCGYANERSAGAANSVVGKRLGGYVAHTSGSTGEPKASVNTTHGIGHLAQAQHARLSLTRSSRVAQLASPGFDAAIFELLMALGSGGTLVVAPPRPMLGGALQTFIDTARLSHLVITPSALTTIDLAAVTGLPRRLEVVVTAGEQLPHSLAEEWAGSVTLINAYGPSEATICATMSEPLSGTDGVPIGRPLPGFEIYICDDTLRLQAAGTIGEIYLAGPAVALGYISRTAETATRFVANPFGTHGTRMYRTGDRGLWREDGQLEFAGRLDRQVKIAGVRLELDEVDTLLRAQPGVIDAVSVLRGDGPGAYVESYVTSRNARPWAARVDDEALAGWRAVHDSAHDTVVSDDFEWAGWLDRNGQPFPAQEMAEWASAFVSLVLAAGPRRIVEIGAGSGIIARRLLQHVDSYVAADFSATAIDKLSSWRQRLDAGERGRVHIVQAGALEPLTLPSPVDTVILNSVIQYFPSEQYLRQVLALCAGYLEGGHGRIIVGDVRNLRLLDAKQASGDPELLLDPCFFDDAADWIEGFTGVELRIKSTAVPAELSASRYEVVLHIGVPTADLSSLATVDARDLESVDDLLQLARRRSPAGLRIEGLGNRRTRSAGSPEGSSLMVDPGDLVRRAAELGLRALASLPRSGRPDTWDLVVVPRAVTGPVAGTFVADYQSESVSNRSGVATAALNRRDLLTALEERLPEVVVPRRVVEIAQMPRSVHGKLAAGDLPRIEYVASVAGEFTDELERVVALTFAEVLRKRVRRDDDFFDLGGHSLLAVRLEAEFAERLTTGVSLADIYERRSPRRVAAAVRERRASSQRFDPVLNIRRTGKQHTLFCIHPAIGTGWSFAALPAHIPDRLDIVAFQSPDLQDERARSATFADAVDFYFSRIIDVQPTGPYHLVGASMGGLLAHSIAQRAAERGESVCLLAVVDAYPSAVYRRNVKSGMAIGAAATDPGAGAGADVRNRNFLALCGFGSDFPEETSLVELRALLASFDSPFGALPLDDLGRLVRSTDNNVHLIETAELLPYRGDVDLFAARAAGASLNDPSSWAAVTTGDLRVSWVPLTHAALLQPAGMDRIGQELGGKLRQGCTCGLP